MNEKSLPTLGGRWRVWCSPSTNGWVSFYARRTDVRKTKSGERHALEFRWNGERFAKSSEIAAFLAQPKAVRQEIMRQMHDILDQGLPPLPHGDWPANCLEKQGE